MYLDEVESLLCSLKLLLLLLLTLTQRRVTQLRTHLTNRRSGERAELYLEYTSEHYVWSIRSCEVWIPMFMFCAISRLRCAFSES